VAGNCNSLFSRIYCLLYPWFSVDELTSYVNSVGVWRVMGKHIGPCLQPDSPRQG
jgi:hypothetical protein